MGNGVNNTSIAGVGFRPDFVLVKALTTANNAVFKTSAHPTGESSNTREDASNLDDGIRNLDGDGFTLGTNARVNQNAITYNYLAIKKDTQNDFQVGVYTGDGLDGKAITGVGFQPVFVFIKPNIPIVGAAKFEGNGNSSMIFAGADRDDLIVSLDDDGFTVNNGSTDTNLVNREVSPHYFFAFSESAAKVFTYSGNGVDSREISGLGLEPKCVFIKGTGAQGFVIRFSSHSGDSSQGIDEDAATNKIQGFSNSGFQVGTDAYVNGSGITYYALAIDKPVPEPLNKKGDVVPEMGSGNIA